MSIPNAQYRALYDALNTVAINAQALAAADTAVGALVAARDRFSGVWTWLSPDRSRLAWKRGLDDAIQDINRYREPFVGLPASPVDPGEWDDLRHAIGRGYNRLWAIEDVDGSGDSEWGAFVSDVLGIAVGTIEALPAVLSSAVHYVTHTAAEATTEVVGAAASGLLPLWPLVAVAAVIATAGVFVLGAAKRKGLLR